MAKDRRWEMSDVRSHLEEVFDAAKSSSPQVVYDEDGSYTVSYRDHGKKGSGRRHLTGGGPEEA
jgi:hypothetical protein